MRLLRLMTLAAVALIVLALGLSSLPLFIGRRVLAQGQWLEQTTQQERRARELQVALLRMERAHRRSQETGQTADARETEQARQALQQALAQLSSALPPTSPDLAALQRAREDILHYLDTLALPDGAPAQADALDAALDSSEAFEGQSTHAALAARDAGRRTVVRTNLAVVAGGLLLTAGLAVLVWAGRRWLYAPLQAIHQALTTFRADAPLNPAPERGPAELRDIAHAFNSLAGRLVHQREQQLGFLSGVAHDLRQPLTTLRATAALMRADRPLPSEEGVRAKFALVGRQAEQLGRMVEDLLDTTRIEAGQLELRRERQDARALVQETVALHHEQLSDRHRLLLTLPAQPVEACWDGARIAQVLNNLVNNALKYSPEGGEVRVALTVEGPQAVVSVTDAGVGIPPAEHESIFEPFRRSPSTRQSIPGVGLGLSVSRRIAHAHGGSLAVESAPGRGSTFHLRLPLAASESSAA